MHPKRSTTLHPANVPCRAVPAVGRAASIAFLLAIAGCSPPIDQAGSVLDPEAIAQIKPGVSTKAEVTQAMGSPTSTGTFDPNTWYYVSRRSERPGPFTDGALLDQKILVVQFDDAGLVKDVQDHGKDIAQDVSMNSRVTPSSGRELSFLEQLLGNVGRFGGSGESSERGPSSGR